MDLNYENISKVVFELREHEDGRWDFCIKAKGEKTVRLKRLPFHLAVKECEKAIRLRNDFKEENK
jgi:hypothetical protein